ncbi:MAG: thiamine phosphate synthase [Candidatus Methanomethylophilaceae archaeon]|nr:thiamine phosphate synthase [Candidatus Methanomethylophilaceae archaeon]
MHSKAKIIAVTDRRIVARPFADQIAAVAESGADMIILREKGLIEPEYRYLATECLAICTEYSIPMCVNSYVRTARALNIEDVQLPLGKMRELRDRDGLSSVGVSVHSVKEAREAERLGADYLIAGPVFKTKCKPDAVPKGTGLITDVFSSVDIPVYAIGGITPYNIARISSKGASGACIRSPMMTGGNLRVLVRELRTNFDAGLEHLQIAGDLVQY